MFNIKNFTIYLQYNDKYIVVCFNLLKISFSHFFCDSQKKN